MNSTPPTWHTVTVWFCIGLTVLAVVFDYFIYREAGVTATISRTLLNAARQYPILAVAIGVLLGHLFASQSGQ